MIVVSKHFKPNNKVFKKSRTNSKELHIVQNSSSKGYKTCLTFLKSKNFYSFLNRTFLIPGTKFEQKSIFLDLSFEILTFQV